MSVSYTHLDVYKRQGMDSHSFEPTPADMITIQNADILVCNGGAMEQWLDKVLDSFGNGAGPGRVVTMTVSYTHLYISYRRGGMTYDLHGYI